MYNSLSKLMKNKKYRILLINPPWELEQKDQDFFRVTQPEGLGYISAVLKKGGYGVKLIDAAACGWKKKFIVDGGKIHYGLSYQEIGDIIKKYNPQLIGISIISSLLKQNGFLLASEIKKRYPATKIVIGGPHPSVTISESLANPNIDYLVFGEGEVTTLELVGQLSKLRPRLRGIKGLAYKVNGKPIINPVRELIKDLDTLPFPDRDQYPMDDYFRASQKLLSSFALSTYNKKWATVISSRGCPYNCIFCSIHLTMGKVWRPRSAENVVSEIEVLVKKLNIRKIAFLDDNMTFNLERMNRICDLITEKKLRFEWSTPNGIRADRLDRNLLLKMKKAGCVRIAVAPESGSQKVVYELIGKGLNLRKVTEVVKICKEIGLKVDCFFVMGIPGETKQNLRQTINYATRLKKIGASGFNIAIATPFIGTRLHKVFTDRGYLKPDFDEFTMFRSESYIETETLKERDLIKYRNLGSLLNRYPLDYLKFILLTLFRDPARFLRLFKAQMTTNLSYSKK